jgi:hypothetical protein
MAIEALRLMEDGRYRHLPIPDDGKAVGIVSHQRHRTGSPRRGDQAVRADLRRWFWKPVATVGT